MAVGSSDQDHAPEWRWALGWALVILAASCLPYLVAWATTPPGYQFGGILVNPLDGNSYLAKMRQGWLGSWQFRLSYTPEPHSGAFIFLFYLALGHVARFSGLPLIAVFHAARLLAGLALLLALYSFICRLTADRRERRLAYVLTGASAGLGALGVLLGTFPIDLWVPEAFAFFSLLANPHFPLGLALMLMLFGGVLWPAPGVRGWLVPGLAGLALAVVQPFALVPVYATVALWNILRIACCVVRKRWAELRASSGVTVGSTASVFLFSAPVLVYDYRVYTANPALAAWAAQNVTPAPTLTDLVLGLGVVGLLAVVGAAVVIHRRDGPGLALLAWGGVTLLLVNLPFALQRRAITGVEVPLALLAALGLARWLMPRLPGLWARRAAGLSLGLGLSGNVFLLLVLALGAVGQQRPSELPGLLYLSRDEAAGMQWLLSHGPDQVVLAAPRTGMLLPGYAGVRVFYGHPFETIDAPLKQLQAEAFLRGQLSAGEWRDVRQRFGVSYVFLGPAERQLGADRLGAEFEPVFQQGEVTIYRAL